MILDHIWMLVHQWLNKVTIRIVDNKKSQFGCFYLLCISTSQRMLAHAFAWSKRIENIGKWRKKYLFLFSSFSDGFDHFSPCECMRKHAFAGRNSQHLFFRCQDIRVTPVLVEIVNNFNLSKLTLDNLYMNIIRYGSSYADVLHVT